jgi:hypothetical protein
MSVADDPIKVTGEIISSPSGDELQDLPKFFHPRRKQRFDYYGVSLPEYLCCACEYLVASVMRMEPGRDADFLRITFARWYKLTLCSDPKVQVLAQKMIGDLAGLAYLWEHKKKTPEINVQLKLSDLIIEATNRLRLVKGA